MNEKALLNISRANARRFGSLLVNPVRGDIWEHTDGGSVFVLRRRGPSVMVQRRPFGDSLAEPFWLEVPAFSRQVTGKIRRVRV